MFQKLDLFLCPQVRGETPTLLRLLQRANLSHWERHLLLRPLERANLNHWGRHLLCWVPYQELTSITGQQLSV
jgi:branched-subunit amino acid transport protein